MHALTILVVCQIRNRNHGKDTLGRHRKSYLQKIHTWLRNGYIALVGGNLLTFERVKLLDWETIAKLFVAQNLVLFSSRPRGHLIDWEQGAAHRCVDLIVNPPTNLWL